jgi:hypothetical protein
VPSIEDVVVHLIIIVLGCKIFAWVDSMKDLSISGIVFVVGRVVDTSMILRTVVSPETSMVKIDGNPGLERCLCVLEVLTIAG